MSFDRSLYLFLCILTTPCIWLRKCCRIDCWCEPAQPTLTLPHSLQIVALPLRCPVWSTTKHKYKNTWMWNTIWLLSTFHNAMSLNWPMGDGYRLWLWNKTLQETEVFLEFWSDLSPIIVATKGRVRLPNRMNFRKNSKRPLTLPPPPPPSFLENYDRCGCIFARRYDGQII